MTDCLDLARSLPRGPLPELEKQDSCLKTQVEPQGPFVSPTLTLRQEATSPVAILITAPAAAGKSTCAMSIANEAGAAYMDLAGILVAQGSFTGLLDEAFGEHASLAFRDGLRSGSLSLVIDSLDEAQVASRETAFTLFLRSLCYSLRLGEGHGNVLMLARPDTSEYVISEFAAAGLELRQFEVDYFDRDRAHEFLDVKLDAHFRKAGKPFIHRSQRQNFKAARDVLLGQLAVATQPKGAKMGEDPWAEQSVRRLLGYSPVLDAVSTYLVRDSYPSATLSNDPATLAGDDEWQVLATLFQDLLEREQAKLQLAWPSKEEKFRLDGEGDLTNVFGPNEQCEWIVLKADNFRLTPTTRVPGALEASYSDAVTSQLFNHPFLDGTTYVSSLFRDYAFSRLLTYSHDTQTLEQVLDRVRDTAVLPSPALGPFLIALAGPQGRIPLSYVDILIDSIQAREDSVIEYWFSLNVDTDSSTLVIQPGTDDHLSKATVVNLHTQDGEVRMPSRSKRTDVQGAREVTFGGTYSRVGPDVHIEAQDVYFTSSELHIDGTDCVIRASSVSASPEQRVTFAAKPVIDAEEREGWPLWSSEQVPVPQINDSDLLPWIYGLRKVMTKFRRTVHVSKEELAASREALHAHVLRTDTYAKIIVDELVSREYMTIRGQNYILQRRVFEDLDTTYVDIQRLAVSPGLGAFLSDLHA